MAYTVKLIQDEVSNIENAVKTYLDGATINTMHSITHTKWGNLVSVLIVYE